MSPASGSGAPRLVCFDLGGVVIRICRSWREGCAAAGLPWRETVPLRELLHDLHDQHERGRIERAAWAEQSSRRMDGAWNPRDLEAVHDAWLLGEYEGVGALIDRVHEAGLLTAALSNTNREHWTRCQRYPAVQRLRHHLLSHDVGLRKPEPAFYRCVEERTGLRGPEIQFFDDLLENVEAAAALGWRAVRIDPAGETAPQIEAALRESGALTRCPAPSPTSRRSS